MKLVDCREHGANAELFLVEGDSAARSVVALRNDREQAVLPLQGKPLNAWKARRAKVEASPLYRQLANALGLSSPVACSEEDLRRLRYARVLLLFDPDADGIHIGALMLLYFKRWLPSLLATGRVEVVRAPMVAISHAGGPAYAYSQPHADALIEQMRTAGAADVHAHVYRGLGSITPHVLGELCVDPRTRRSRVAGEEDIAAVMQAFGLAERPLD
ncbi:toprim domain-containing protein [Thermomonas sp. HDW16]|uniref:toprim domain-containing protein n=1 Tax=Thermomonas sp. HDW16 TaxID=2714945 RepID=UPI00140B3AE5|nr:toprim domain-containing protein [Thermomonas sp. HDW16]QIL19634.1 DNA gyrase subunit B [Thermomonas sp. HDW16]